MKRLIPGLQKMTHLGYMRTVKKISIPQEAMKENGKSESERERERERERKEDFQKQMNEVVRVDTAMQILNLMTFLYEKKTMIESV